MLKKQARLDRPAFTTVFRAGKRSHTPHLQLLMVSQGDFAASVVVSKKVAKTAVARNQLRRRIYNLLQEYKQEQSLTGKYIFITKPGACELPFSELKTEIVGLIGKNRLNTVQ